MIPKTIHYCWFGRGEKPKLAKKCIASWKKYCPDYQIIEWNEDNFNLDYNDYTRFCYDHQKWAFLSDIARLIIVEEYGGIYLDTDVELIKDPTPLLQHDAFYGFETARNIASGLGFGAVSHQKSVQLMLDQYSQMKPDQNGNYILYGCPGLNTKALQQIGLQLNGKTQEINGVMIYSPEYFNPYDDPTGRLNRTEDTYSIHWYAKSWMSRKSIIRSKLTKPLHRAFGTDFFRKKE